MAKKPSKSKKRLRDFALSFAAVFVMHAASPLSAQDVTEGAVPGPAAVAIQTMQDESGQLQEMNEFPVVRLRSLDKVTARTQTFEANVGSTVKFGSLFIKVQICRKAPPVEQPEAASFMQIWEITHEGEAQWVFSGWMFASSPGLSHMDHPIYDVWVLDCLSEKGDRLVDPELESREGEGELDEEDVPDPPAPEGAAAETEVIDSEAWDGGEAPAQEQPPFGNPGDEIRIERLND